MSETRWTPKIGGSLESILAGALATEYRKCGYDFGNGTHLARVALAFMSQCGFAPPAASALPAPADAADAKEGE